jgi:hypothetical protein
MSHHPGSNLVSIAYYVEYIIIYYYYNYVNIAISFNLLLQLLPIINITVIIIIV